MMLIFCMAKEQGKKGVTISYMIIEGSDRNNHYAIFAGPNIVGDISGETLRVMPMDALHLLSEASVKRRGLNKVEIETEDNKVRAKMAEFRRLEREADTKDLRDSYIEQAKKLWEKYTTSNLVQINVGLEMAVCAGEAFAASKEGLIPYSKATVERIEKEGWKYKPL